MALVKVTAIKQVTLIDPFPIEGVGLVTIQQDAGEYKAYEVYDHQADRLKALLDDAVTAGLITYEIEWDDSAAVNPKRYLAFTFNDVTPGGSILLGTVPAGTAVSSAVVVVNIAFDGATEISIGDASESERLLAVAHNDPTAVESYQRDVNYRYLVDTQIYVYFPAGTPTVGAAEVFVYLA